MSTTNTICRFAPNVVRTITDRDTNTKATVTKEMRPWKAKHLGFAMIRSQDRIDPITGELKPGTKMLCADMMLISDPDGNEPRTIDGRIAGHIRIKRPFTQNTKDRLFQDIKRVYGIELLHGTNEEMAQLKNFKSDDPVFVFVASEENPYTNRLEDRWNWSLFGAELDANEWGLDDQPKPKAKTSRKSTSLVTVTH